MLQSWVIIPVALAYLGTLFAIAYYGDQRADQGRSIIANPYIYALSLGVYATAWTFYGSVGRAAADGDRLPSHLHRSDADDGAVVGGDAQDHQDQQGEPHHVAGRLRLVALRQERRPRRTRHDHRGDRGRAVHRAAAEGGVAQFHHPGPVSGGCDGGAARRGPDPRRHRVLGGACARDVHHPVRHASPGRLGAPRGPGRGDRVRVDRKAGRVPCRRVIRHLWHL